MTQAELQKVLREVDTAAVLVSARILERIIREDCNLPNMVWNVPHWKSYVCDRQLLFRHAEQADLELESDQLLPDTVILLVRPDAEEMSNLERLTLLLKYWRRLFHSRIHVELRKREQAGDLGDDAVRERIEQIGRPEFEEIREVLTQDRYLPPTADDRHTYVEFAAVYLEMRYFTANLLPNYFPGIRDFGKIERLLVRDVDAASLFPKTRLRGAPDPVQPRATRIEESEEAYWKLVRSAKRASDSRNTVKAAIQHMRASRIAPAAQTGPTRLAAEEEIDKLTARVGEAVGLQPGERAEWARFLKILLEKADQGKRPIEAQVLEDLQKVCLDHEKDIYTLDLVEFVVSFGKRPIKRPLPSQRLVRITRHLHSAIQKLGEVRLSDADRANLTRLMQHALNHTEEALRARFRPVLVTALEDVGLEPTNPIERVAFDKMIAELLDRISTHGYLTFAELRDTISRNQLKFADLSDPEDFIRGDPLIRMDRRLASLLDGVYRPGEFYVRWLERFTSLKFGTWFGRMLTLWVTLPFGIAYVVLHMLGVVVEYADKWFGLHEEVPHFEEVTLTLLGPFHKNQFDFEEPSLMYHVIAVAVSGLFTVAMMRSARFRKHCLRLLSALWQGLYWLFVGVPRAFIPVDLIQHVYNSLIFQLFYWYLLKPGLIAFVFFILWRAPWHNPYVAVTLFLLINVVINSRAGRGASEAISDGLVQLAGMVRSGLFLAAFHGIIHVFKKLVEAIEYVLYLIDEWLRFRGGDSQASLVVRTIASTLWTPVAFLIRFYMVVLVEPMINPVKFPISTVSAKILYPLILPSVPGVTAAVAVFLGDWAAWAIVASTATLLPDAAGFLVWEMKENWSLFRANRSRNVRPATVGSHGESIRGLLQPGFHSGTVPLLFARLRQAERKAAQTRDWNSARQLRHEVEHVAEATQQFVQREMIALLRQSRSWQHMEVTAGPVSLSTNRIRLELDHADHPSRPVEINLGYHHGWIVARIRDTGWLEALDIDQRRTFLACLGFCYKRSDVDLVVEQIQSALQLDNLNLQLTPAELILWGDGEAPVQKIPLRLANESKEQSRFLDRLVFARTPITWEQWTAAWQQDQEGNGHPGLPGLDAFLVCLPPLVPESAGAPRELSTANGDFRYSDEKEGSGHGKETTESRPETQAEGPEQDQETTEPHADRPGLRGRSVQDG